MSDILVVEDETVLAKSIVAFLERRGFSARFYRRCGFGKDDVRATDASVGDPRLQAERR
ncbi:response regulator [Primorskyibacter sp. 2E233]|uniref:response regulator n=1 Tax=Primorskyibacter sp. 2E233 TaxID=3413431 RepID=UPI003BF372F6